VENKFLDMVKVQLEMEMPRSSFTKYVSDMVATEYANGQLTIACRGSDEREWAESRLTSTMQRQLTGAMNADVTVRFIVEAP
jgi:hypothetical protein